MTDVGSLGDTVREFEAGAVVPPEDAAALAEACSRLLREPAQDGAGGATTPELGAFGRGARAPVRTGVGGTPDTLARREIRRHRRGGLHRLAARGSARRQRGDEVVGIDSFTDYYDPNLKQQNAEGLDVRRRDLARDELDFAGFDGVFHLAGQPGVRSFGDVFPLYVERNVLASQRVFEAAARDGVRVVFASSSSVYGEAERYPTPEDTPPAPVSPYGITKLTCEHLARAYGRSFGLDAVVLRYFNAFGPRQRPDMAFTKVARALATEQPFDLYGDGEQSRGWTYVDDVVDATMRAMERGQRHVQRRRRGRGLGAGGDRDSRGPRRPYARDPPSTSPFPATSGARTPTRRASAPSSAGRRRSRSRTACGRSGNGPRLQSARHEPRFRAAIRGRAGGRARGRLRALRADDRRPLVAARRRRRARRAHRLPRLALGREDLQGDRAGLPRPAARARLARPPSPRSPTTLGLVQAFVTSEEAIEKAASAAGLRPSRLRDNVTVRPIPGTSTTQAGLSGAAALDSGHGLARAGRRPPRRTISRSRPWTRWVATRTRRSTRSTSSSRTSTRSSGS